MPETVSYSSLCRHIRRLTGAKLTFPNTDLIEDYAIAMWFDFNYRGYEFSINNQFGEYWFFVNDPTCPDKILEIVAQHFSRLLQSKGIFKRVINTLGF